MVAGGRGLQSCAGEKGGSATGPSPVDRARNGSKHHLLVDATGIPLAWTVTGGNRNDVTQLIPLLDRVPPVRGKVGRPRRRPERSPPTAATTTTSTGASSRPMHGGQAGLTSASRRGTCIAPRSPRDQGRARAAREAHRRDDLDDVTALVAALAAKTYKRETIQQVTRRYSRMILDLYESTRTLSATSGSNCRGSRRRTSRRLGRARRAGRRDGRPRVRAAAA